MIDEAAGRWSGFGRTNAGLFNAGKAKVMAEMKSSVSYCKWQRGRLPRTIACLFFIGIVLANGLF
jgi:hypothetical protein